MCRFMTGILEVGGKVAKCGQRRLSQHRGAPHPRLHILRILLIFGYYVVTSGSPPWLVVSYLYTRQVPHAIEVGCQSSRVTNL
jgi:hypothetical protein